MRDYSDMVYMSYQGATKYPRMPRAARAAQFSPFAALTGHDAAIKETARLTEDKIELSDDMIEILDRKLRQLEEGAFVEITFFRPDSRKSGGAYETKAGVLKGLDAHRRCVLFEDGEVIPIEDIYDVNA